MTNEVQEAITAEAERLEQELPATEVRQWTAVKNLGGEWVTKCPWCGAMDEIKEIDKSYRWNTLQLSDDGKTAEASLGDSDWEGDGWICMGCMNENLDAPADFEITDWY